jgi:hypothetical protein
MNTTPYRTPLLVAILFLAASTLPVPAAPGDPDDPTQQIRGTVASIAGNHTCFDINDRNGNRTTIFINKNTHFYLADVDATFADVLFIGDDIQANLGPNSVAVDVTNRNRARVFAFQIRPALDCTDEEWAVLSPLITNILQAQRAIAGRGMSDIRTAIGDLQTTLQNNSAMNSDILFKLRTLRATRAKAQAALDKAQQDLISLLTPRQEAVLVEQGVLN